MPTTGQRMVIYVVSWNIGARTSLGPNRLHIAKRRIEHQIRMDTVETQARRLLVAPHEETIQDQQETAEEFYPEGVVVETALTEPHHGKKKAPEPQSPAPDPEPQAAAAAQSQAPGNGGKQEAPEPEQVTEMIGGVKVTLEPNEFPTAPPPPPKGTRGRALGSLYFNR